MKLEEYEDKDFIDPYIDLEKKFNIQCKILRCYKTPDDGYVRHTCIIVPSKGDCTEVIFARKDIPISFEEQMHFLDFFNKGVQVYAQSSDKNGYFLKMTNHIDLLEDPDGEFETYTR